MCERADCRSLRGVGRSELDFCSVQLRYAPQLVSVSSANKSYAIQNIHL